MLRTSEIFFQPEKRIFVSPSGHVMIYCIYYVNTNEIPNHFTLTVFWCERCDLLCSHSKGDIFTCEDNMYTCQLFLRYKCEIFILGVLGFLQTTRPFPKIPEEFRSLPKTSEVCRRRSYRKNAYPQNQRSRGRYCYLFIYTWFSFLT